MVSWRGLLHRLSLSVDHSQLRICLFCVAKPADLQPLPQPHAISTTFQYKLRTWWDKRHFFLPLPRMIACLWTMNKKNDSFSVAWICGGFLGAQRLCFGVLMDIDEAHNNKEPDTKFHKLCDERFWNTDPQTLSGKYWSQVEHRKMTHTFYNGETWVVMKPEPLDLWNFRISWNSKQTHHSYLDPKETSEEFRFENISA